jgi:hypothetical protein
VPELDDDELFGTRSDDSYDDDDESRGGDEDEDLEGQFDDDDAEDEKPAKPAAKGADDKGDSKRDNSKTVTLTAKEHRELLERIREKETEEAYWRGKAESGGKGRKSDPDDEEDDAPPVRKAKPAAADDEEDDADLLDAISKGGTKALKARGFVRMADVEGLIEEKATAIAEKIAGRKVSQATEALHSDAALMRQFPELADEKSDFYERVGKEVRDLVGKDKALAKSQAVISMAARNVKLQLDLEARSKRQADADRDWRKNKQAPRGGSSRGGDGEGGEPLSPAVRDMLRQMGVSEKGYRQEQKRLRGAGY